MSQALGPDVTDKQLLPLFVRLLQDAEADVRAAAAACVTGYCDLVGDAKFVSEIVPSLRENSVDAALPVRSTCWCV